MTLASTFFEIKGAWFRVRVESSVDKTLAFNLCWDQISKNSSALNKVELTNDNNNLYVLDYTNKLAFNGGVSGSWLSHP